MVASLSRWRDTCSALGAGTVEELATSPFGVRTAGKDRGAFGAGPCGRAGGRGNREEEWIQRSEAIIVPCFKFTGMLKCTLR